MIELKHFVKVKTMIKSGTKFWKWPSRENVIDCSFNSIVKVINPPNISHFGTFSVPEIEYMIKYCLTYAK